MPASLDSKAGHYISTVAQCASLSHHRTAMEKSENVTSSCSLAQVKLPHLPESTECSLARFLHAGNLL